MRRKRGMNEALAEYIQRRRQSGIIGLFHTVDYDPEYDYKAERKNG